MPVLPAQADGQPSDPAQVIQQVTALLTQALDLMSQLGGPPPEEATPAPGPQEQFGQAFSQAAGK